MVLKVADLGHTYSPLDQHLRWAAALEEELFRQGDKERGRGLPVSPLCDRHKPGGGVTQSQSGFFKIVVLPLLETFTSRFPAALPLLERARANCAHWEARSVRHSTAGAGPKA
jgi:cAMP-specific phosphodiesterase 4